MTSATRITIRVLSLTLLLLAGCGRVHIIGDALTPEEHLRLALAYEKDQKIDLAEKEFEKASVKLPLANLYWGNLLYGQKRYGEAESRYRRAMKALPEHPEAYNNLAWMFCERGEKLDEALALARRAAALAPPERQAAYRDTLDCVKKKLGRQ